MSLPLKPQHHIHIELTATEAECLANGIARALELARKIQQEYSAQCSYDKIVFSVSDGIELEILPDKRHKGCSGYHHY